MTLITDQTADHDIQIQLNGEPYRLSPCTIAALVEALGFTGQRIAVEHNEAIVPRSQHASVNLDNGDSIEIIHAVGGG